MFCGFANEKTVGRGPRGHSVHEILETRGGKINPQILFLRETQNRLFSPRENVLSWFDACNGICGFILPPRVSRISCTL